MVETKTKSYFSWLSLSRPRPPEVGRNGDKSPIRIKDPIDDLTARFELPRTHFKPADGIDFFADGSLTVTANMAYTQVAGFTLPFGHEGVIKFIGQGADAPSLFTDTRWQLLINSVTVRGWFDFAFRRGTLSEPLPVTIYIPTSSVVSFQIRNTTAAPYTAEAILIGWTWIVKDIKYATMD